MHVPCLFPSDTAPSEERDTEFPWGGSSLPAPLAFYVPHLHNKVRILRGSTLFCPSASCCGWNKIHLFLSVFPRYSGSATRHSSSHRPAVALFTGSARLRGFLARVWFPSHCHAGNWQTVFEATASDITKNASSMDAARDNHISCM